MKKTFIAAAIAALSVTAVSAEEAKKPSGMLMVGTGVGQETVNDMLTVDLVEAGAMYRFPNGVMVGGSVQKGYPDLSALPTEVRTEGKLGYSTRVDRFMPYGTVSYGERDRGSAGSYNYYATQVGTKYMLNDKAYLDVSYRYRDTDEATWQSKTMFAGVGYNLSKQTSVQFQVGNTTGDYESDSVAVFLINRF